MIIMRIIWIVSERKNAQFDKITRIMINFAKAIRMRRKTPSDEITKTLNNYNHGYKNCVFRHKELRP